MAKLDINNLTNIDSNPLYDQPLVHSEQTAKTSKATPKQPTFFNGWAGTGPYKGDPYVSGYAFIKWLRHPGWINEALSLTANDDMSFAAYSEKNFKSLSGISNIELEFDAIKAGFSQNETMFAKSLGQKSSEISLKYQEHSGGGLKAYYDAWISGIRDPKTNVATYPKRFGIPYHHNNHTGTLLYVVTRPDADNWLAAEKGDTGGEKDNIIEFAAIFTGVVPTTINLEHFNYESGNHEFTENEQKFKCYMNIGSRVEEIAYTVMKQIMQQVKLRASSRLVHSVYLKITLTQQLHHYQTLSITQAVIRNVATQVHLLNNNYNLTKQITPINR
jgi:hypothetical protein